VELPPLRDELLVDVGPRSHDGQPGWTLQDPARNRFFRLDWLTFEIVQRWSLRDPELIVRNIGEQTPLRSALADIEHVLKFLAANQLLKLAGADNSGALAAARRQAEPGLLTWLVHNYLFFRVPLVRPERVLAWMDRRAAFLFSPWFWRTTMAAGAIGFALVARQWDMFLATWRDLATVSGAASFLAVIVGVKILHELGHGIVATHFGCRVPSMGIAFLVMTPVAYTDTNDAWKLADRRQRLLIGAAGVLAELGVAVWATLAWTLLPEGYLRSAAFVVATTTWIKSLVINTSPVMRFDGYYLLSDWLDIPNLHSRAFALAQWQLREWLFALGETPPEQFRRPLRRGLVALATFIWVYRLVVFTGIAVFVYHYFFKALGIVLFGVEIGWFVAIPIVNELAVWVKRRREIARSHRARRLLPFLLFALAILAVPFPQRIKLVGELSPVNEFRVIAPEPAQLVELATRDGARVEQGAPLLRMSSDILMHRLEVAKVREANVRAEAQAAEADAALRPRLPSIQAAIPSAEAAHRETEVAIEQLAPRAPFAGRFRLADCDLRPGEWVERQEEIATVFGEGAWQVVGYVDEGFSHLLAPGATGWFYPDGCPETRVPIRLTAVDRDATRTISRPTLTTPFGGSLPARVVDGNLVPDRGVYRVLLATTEANPELMTEVRRGQVVIHGRAESLLARLGRAIGAVVWREAGF
jgi:putative peptide zinc metalloprotease protein